jgi:hypothetical protein
MAVFMSPVDKPNIGGKRRMFHEIGGIGGHLLTPVSTAGTGALPVVCRPRGIAAFFPMFPCVTGASS